VAENKRFAALVTRSEMSARCGCSHGEEAPDENVSMSLTQRLFLIVQSVVRHLMCFVSLFRVGGLNLRSDLSPFPISVRRLPPGCCFLASRKRRVLLFAEGKKRFGDFLHENWYKTSITSLVLFD
jgi:hypothetical protein